jgi:hypothetical protein
MKQAKFTAYRFPRKANIQQCQQASMARSERLQSEHVQRGHSREYDAHVMSAEWSIKARNEPHSARRGALRHRSPSPVLTARLPSRLNSLDKRAVCTTSVEFDVDAAVNDRTASTCGVSDVLSASPVGVGASSMMLFLPRLSKATRANIHHRVSLAVGVDVPAPWTE